jgi:hypothetical protein
VLFLKKSEKKFAFLLPESLKTASTCIFCPFRFRLPLHLRSTNANGMALVFLYPICIVTPMTWFDLYHLGKTRPRHEGSNVCLCYVDRSLHDDKSGLRGPWRTPLRGQVASRWQKRGVWYPEWTDFGSPLGVRGQGWAKKSRTSWVRLTSNDKIPRIWILFCYWGFAFFVMAFRPSLRHVWLSCGTQRLPLAMTKAA